MKVIARRSLEYYRNLIRAEAHILMLDKFAAGEITVSPERINVAMYLINKVMPNVASLKVSMGDGARVTVVEVPSIMRSTEDWERAVEERRALAAKPVNGNGAEHD